MAEIAITYSLRENTSYLQGAGAAEKAMRMKRLAKIKVPLRSLAIPLS